MREILYDNGAVSRKEKEFVDDAWLDKVADKLEVVILNNDDIANVDVLCSDLATGEMCEVNENYAHLQGFSELNKVLNDYFEQI